MKKTGRILGDEMTGVNQILPHANLWAWEMYLASSANHWSPNEISMGRDIEQWKSGAISPDEKLLVKRCMGFFAGSESLVSNNLLLTVAKYVTDPECRQFLITQIKEEGIHNHTVVYVCDSLGMSVDEVFGAYESVPTIKAKDDWLMAVTKDVHRADFDIRTLGGKREFLRNLVTFYVITEGLLFYSNFASLLSLGRRNLMPGLCEQIMYSLRDEGGHIKFGINLINKIIQQEEGVIDESFKRETLEHIEHAVALEISYVRESLPRGIMGLNEGLLVDFMHYLGNNRLEAIGLPAIFPAAKNPFPWLAETIETKKNRNFFETRVVAYSKGTLVDDL